MGFVDKSEQTSLGDAANVTVELESKGRLLRLVSNDNGDYSVELPKGIYCLKAARSADNQPLSFSPRQPKCFKVESDKDVRFDVMLLKGPNVFITSASAQQPCAVKQDVLLTKENPAIYITSDAAGTYEDVFGPVPADLRASLLQRLKLLVEYQRTQQWEKHYDLLSITATQGDTKAQYARRNRRWYTEVVPEDLILDFIPKATTAHESSADAGWWTIYGCAKLRRKGQLVELYAAVDAYREGGKWYFSPVGVITAVDGHPEPKMGDNRTSSVPGLVP